MKLLILSHNPNRASFRQRIEIYLGIMKSSGIEPVVETLSGSWIQRLRVYPHAVDYDVVLLHKKLLNPLDAACLKKYARHIIFNFDDAVMYNDKHPDRPGLLRTMAFRRTVKVADRILVGSSYLARQAFRYQTNPSVIPIGLRISDYQLPNSGPADRKIRLVWIGSQSTLNYIRPLYPVFKILINRFKHLVIRIICDDFPNWQDIPLEKLKWSADLRGRDLGQCNIGLGPLPDNPFTQGKCSFKVLEYGACGLPVVASPVGTNVDHIREGISGFLVNSENEWVEKLAQLIENESLRKKMGQEGRAIAQNHDISIIGRQFCHFLSQFAHK